MASVNYEGPYTYGSTSGVWHTKSPSASGVVMAASGTLSASRDGSTISGSVTNAKSIVVNSGGWFGYHTWIYVYATTSEKTWQVGRKEVTRTLHGKGDSWTTSFDFSFSTNSKVTLTVVYHCADSNNESGSCHQYYNGQNFSYVTMNGSITLDEYNPYTPPTAPTSCTVNKTRVKPDGSLSVSWSGESGGTHGIAKFQLEMSVWRNGTQIHSYTRISDSLYYKDVGYQPSTVNLDLSNLQNYDSGSRIKLRPRRHCSVLYSLLQRSRWSMVSNSNCYKQ